MGLALTLAGTLAAAEIPGKIVASSDRLFEAMLLDARHTLNGDAQTDENHPAMVLLRKATIHIGLQFKNYGGYFRNMGSGFVLDNDPRTIHTATHVIESLRYYKELQWKNQERWKDFKIEITFTGPGGRRISMDVDRLVLSAKDNDYAVLRLPDEDEDLIPGIEIDEEVPASRPSEKPGAGK